MQRDFIAGLICPYTGSPFDVSASGDPSVGFGIATSEAGRFPVIGGILRLLSDELQKPLVDLIERGRNETALRTALDVPAQQRWQAIVDRLWRRLARYGGFGPAAFALGPGKQELYRLATRPDIAFATLAAEATAEAWARWQMHRFSMPSFLPVYALSHVAKGCHTILDFGCGLGHSTFLMKRLAPRARVVCADYSFTSLFLARRFLVADAQCICLDGDYALPFRERYFDCVFSTDAIQYIESKLGLAREFQRVLSADGTIVLAHLHNRFSAEGSTGKALTAQGYANLFEGMARRVYPEDKIVADYVAHDTLDLEQRWAFADLDRMTDGLSLIAARTESVFGIRRGILDAHIDAMRHPNLNPAYRTTPWNGTWTVAKTVAPPYAVERRVNDSSVLPSTWQTGLESLESSRILALRDADRARLRELVRRFIVLEMPESYLQAPSPSMGPSHPDAIMMAGALSSTPLSK